jgi:hypothetical protein
MFMRAGLQGREVLEALVGVGKARKVSASRYIEFFVLHRPVKPERINRRMG